MGRPGSAVYRGFGLDGKIMSDFFEEKKKSDIICFNPSILMEIYRKYVENGRAIFKNEKNLVRMILMYYMLKTEGDY